MSSSPGEGVGERWQGEADGKTGLREEDGRTVFAERVSPPPRLVIVGAGDIAEAICALARPLGWHTQVVEPRSGLATRERVPSADELVVAWPDEIEVDASTAVVSLVHEERLDLPALQAGVAGGAFYVGALGSRRTQEKRRAALGDEVADQVRGPVGLKLGGETPAEIALEIVAEILAVTKSVPVPAPEVTAYAALLRGINVGGNNKVPMPELKALFEELGFADVVTYIQSGNVVFRAPSADAGAIEQRIKEVFGLERGGGAAHRAPSWLRSRRGNPFLDRGRRAEAAVRGLPRPEAGGRCGEAARPRPLARRSVQPERARALPRPSRTAPGGRS